MPMDPNTRGNPPFEPSSYAAGLERRLERYIGWSKDAREQARRMMEGTPAEQESARAWWRVQLNQPPVVLS